MDPMTMLAIGGSIASAGGSIFGALSSAKGQASANAANMEMAQKQMDFQERMDNSKYQRGVEDARKAGFNPLVAFPGSGGSPMGASAVMQNTSPNRGELAVSTARALNEVRSTLADAKLKEEMIKTETTKQGLNNAQASASRGVISIPGVGTVPIDRAADAIKLAKEMVWSKKNPPKNTYSGPTDFARGSLNRAGQRTGR